VLTPAPYSKNSSEASDRTFPRRLDFCPPVGPKHSASLASVQVSVGFARWVACVRSAARNETYRTRMDIRVHRHPAVGCAECLRRDANRVGCRAISKFAPVLRNRTPWLADSRSVHSNFVYAGARRYVQGFVTGIAERHVGYKFGFRRVPGCFPSGDSTRMPPLRDS